MHRWLDEVEELSRNKLPAAVFRYIAEGAREEISLRESVLAWESVRLLPRVLEDVRRVELTTSLLGSSYAAPIGVAPMTLMRAADPDGELAMADAAAMTGIPMVVSSNAGSTFAEIAERGVSWWLQAYVASDREASSPYLEAAAAAGARAVVLTADTPVLGTRYPVPGPNIWETAEPGWLGVNPGVTTTGHRPEERDKAMDLGPPDIGWLRERTGLPVVVKGVLRPDDARRCVDAGAAGVWVSNHGGRQLDQAVAPALCVAGVRAAVGDEAEVYVDGGVRSGLHALIGLALGADAVFVGRPLYHALAAAGRKGVHRALAELMEELEEAMRLTGSPTTGALEGLVAGESGRNGGGPGVNRGCDGDHRWRI